MFAVHGLWANGALQLWAEDSALPRSRDVVRGGRSAARPHPFCRAAAWIPDLLAEIAEPTGDLARKAAEDELTIWLPSAADGPLPSVELTAGSRGFGTGRPSRARPRLAAWRVPTLAFGPAAASGALAILSAVGAEGLLQAEAAIGGTVHYLAAVSSHATSLVRRGRVLPALAPEPDSGSGYTARWRPVLSGTDAERAAELARAMPPLCRAAATDREPAARSGALTEGAAPGRGPAGRGPAGRGPAGRGPAGQGSVAVLTDALDALTDAAARAALIAPAGPVGEVQDIPRVLRGRPAARSGGRAHASARVAQRWIGALAGADPHVQVTTEEERAAVAELAGALDRWRAAAQVPAGPVRTCFRLIEPPAATEPAAPGEPDAPGEPGAKPGSAPAAWRIEFALQSTSDPSLVISAADIWAGARSSGMGDPAAGMAHPEEELLAGLGRAARLFPQLGAELRAATPAGVTVDAAGAYRFLKETAPLLAGAGFGVLLPAWARRARLGIKLTTRSAAPGGQKAGAGGGAGGFGLADLVAFRYDLAIGDQAVDPDELAELARLKVPLVRLRGQWVELDDRQLSAALRFLERGGASGTMRAGDALLTALHGGAGSDGLPLVEVQADGWLADLLSGQADRRLEPVAAPASFHGELRPYQQRGVAWLSFLNGLGLGGILADDMGLGKTVMMLALLAAERATAVPENAGEIGTPRAAVREDLPTLLICPMSLVGNWHREAQRFTPGLNVHVHHGADRLSGDGFAAAVATADLVITTYAVAARDRAALGAVSWGRVVCDEAQNIKNSSTKQAQAARGLRAPARVALTGTPVENDLGELWSIMEFTNPGLLGPAERFRRSYAIPIERNGDDEAAAALKRLTGPFILRRLKTDRSIISDLPDKLEMKVWCNLTAEQASLYQATALDMLAKIEEAAEGIERRGLVLATMAKLKQVCNHPAHLLGDGSRLRGRSGKLARLEEICDEVVAEGDKALCFTQYAEFGAMLQPYLAARLGCPVLYLHGGTPRRERDGLVARFQQAAEPAVFLLSLKAGGTGLNLTAANHVIHMDRWWNPAVEDQATDRAFRIGQGKNVQVRKFVCVGTIEERIDEMIEKKKALAERIVGTGESWLTELSVAELREVIELTPEAVSE